MEIKLHPEDDSTFFTKKIEDLEQLQANVATAVAKALEEEGVFDEKLDEINSLQDISEGTEPDSSKV